MSDAGLPKSDFSPAIYDAKVQFGANCFCCGEFFLWSRLFNGLEFNEGFEIQPVSLCYSCYALNESEQKKHAMMILKSYLNDYDLEIAEDDKEYSDDPDTASYEYFNYIDCQSDIFSNAPELVIIAAHIWGCVKVGKRSENRAGEYKFMARAEILFIKGLACLDEENYKDAVDFFIEALQYDPSFELSTADLYILFSHHRPLVEDQIENMITLLDNPHCMESSDFKFCKKVVDYHFSHLDLDNTCQYLF